MACGGETITLNLHSNLCDKEAGLSLLSQVRAHVGEVRQLVLDMSRVEAVSSYGIFALVESYQQCREHNATLRLAALSYPVKQIIHALRLSECLCPDDVCYAE